ncbi:MAG: VanZ family protein [Rikenellaceae bacterium]
MLYILLITLLSLINISQKENSIDITYLDKIIHFCFYFGLNTLLLLLREVIGRNRRLLGAVAITFVTILYGAGIEAVQHFVGRDFDIFDIAANSVGAIVALPLFMWFRCVAFNKVGV